MCLVSPAPGIVPSVHPLCSVFPGVSSLCAPGPLCPIVLPHSVPVPVLLPWDILTVSFGFSPFCSLQDCEAVFCFLLIKSFLALWLLGPASLPPPVPDSSVRGEGPLHTVKYVHIGGTITETNKFDLKVRCKKRKQKPKQYCS